MKKITLLTGVIALLSISAMASTSNRKIEKLNSVSIRKAPLTIQNLIMEKYYYVFATTCGYVAHMTTNYEMTGAQEAIIDQAIETAFCEEGDE